MGEQESCHFYANGKDGWSTYFLLFSLIPLITFLSPNMGKLVPFFFLHIFIEHYMLL